MAGSQDIEGLWHRVRDAGLRSLALDYDGTLAPFRVERMAARPLEGVPELLEGIRDRARTRLALVSGRPVSELLQLVGELGVTMVGSHGFERREPNGTQRVIGLAAEQRACLVQAEADLHQRCPRERWERKVASVALHTRGLAADAAAELTATLDARWRPGAEAARCEVRAFDGGLELRALGSNKGTALSAWLDEGERYELSARGGEHLAVYIGDDETDEDAFVVLRHRGGVGIKVGAGPTAAAARLDNCAAVRELLARWLEVMR